MAKKADVVTQNFRLGVVEKLGVDYETVRKVNPRIVYGSVTGLGDKGPDARDPVFDILGQARGGFMWLMSTPEDEVTYKVAGGLADQTGALILAYGIMSALVARERFGVGQHVQTSQLGGQLTLQAMALNFYLMAGNTFTHGRRQEAGNPLWNIYQCGDGKWIALGCNQSERYWTDFCQVLGALELLEDPRFKDHLTRYANCKPLVEVLDRLFAMRPRDEWVRDLKARGVIAGPVQTHEEIPRDPQVIANDYLAELPHPVHGKLKQVGVTVKLGETPARARSSAPEFGQHTEDVLQEFGYTWEQIAGFRERGAI
jgi:crotonobetainyl-CoA:carnitine CoA-transferase CaiB-like acyl-CoA transferase